MASRQKKQKKQQNKRKQREEDDMIDEGDMDNDLDERDQADLADFNDDKPVQEEEEEDKGNEGMDYENDNIQEIDEDEEDDDQQQNNEYQYDDFVVADDLDDGKGEKKKKRKKRKKERKQIGEEQEESDVNQEELDEDDLLLIQDNKEQKIVDKQHRRLKRVANIAQEIDEEEENLNEEGEIVQPQDMDQSNKIENALEQIRIRKDGESSGDEFIDDDNVDDEYAQDINKEKLEEKNFQNRQAGGQGELNTNLQQLIDVFGDMNEQDFMDEEIGNQDQEMLDDHQKVKVKTIQEIFEPAEIEELYQTSEDRIIKESDIPERIQLRNKHRQKLMPSNKELVDETNWICERMLLNKNPSPQNPEEFKKKILKTLEYITVHNNEVMYLYFYKKFELFPDLSLQDLWDIYELDFEWSGFNQQRELLVKEFDQLQEYQKVSPYISDMLKTNNNKIILNYLQEYCNFHYSKYVDKNQDIQSTYKRPINKPFAREAVQYRLDHFAHMAGLSADQLAENILLETKSKQANFDSHIPKFYDITPDNAAEEYLNEQSHLTREILVTLTSLCMYMAQEIYYQPVIRKYVRDIYFEKVCISTEPTPKGIKELDVTKYRFVVKRIKNRQLKYFTDETFMLMLECEKLNLIKITFNLPWQEDLKNSNKNYKDIKDEIYQRLLQNSITPFDSNLTEQQNEIVTKWNILRGEAIKNYLSDYMYPHLEKAVRTDLTEISQKYIIAQCGKKFRDMLYVGPYIPELQSSKREEARICAVVFEKEANKLTTVFLNQYGELQDHQAYKYLMMSNFEKEKNNYEKDKRDFEEKLELHKPDCIVISTNCIEARRIKFTMSNLVQKDKNNNQDTEIHVSYGDYVVPQLYAKTYKSTKDFPNLNTQIREAISLGRTKQNQMAEILNLWNENLSENAALFIPLHPLQQMVQQNKLKQEFSRIAIQSVNEVGVDINLCVKHKHLQAQLQFICGLGPRKAQHLIEQIQFITDQNAQLQFRMELWARKILDKTVYINCIGFLKIKDHIHNKNDNDDDESPQHSASEKDILDMTRIHPENYVLAKKIAKDAVEEEGNQEEESAELVEKVMKNPQKLDDLDLDDYALHLAQVKGKPNMIHLLKFIVDELTIPFKDPRIHKEIEQKELFYKLSKESPSSFKPYSFVTVSVMKIITKTKSIQCKIHQNNLIGYIHKDCLEPQDQKLSDDKLFEKFSTGQILQARIKKIDFQQFSVDLTIKQIDMQTNQNYLEELIPNWKMIRETFLLKEDEDYPIFAQSKQKDGRKYIPRKINHPQFRNMSFVAAVDYLSDKNIGDFLFRPSSKGTDYLNITWKFYDHVISHLEIKEGAKDASSLISKKLILQQQAYESLDEIIDKYIKPCNQFMLGITAFKKFIKTGIEALESELREEKDNNPKNIPYYFCCSEQTPQYVILGYMPKQDEILKEYIKVKPNGLWFHNYYFTSLQMLVSWFKENFRTPEYQRYLRKIKAPIQMEAMQANKQQYGFSPSYNQQNTTESPSYAHGIKAERKIKFDHDEGQSDKVCNTCGQKGHQANECPQTQSYSQWNNQSSDQNAQKGGFQNQERKPYNQQNRKPGTCYNCGEEGHMSRECTKEKKKQGGDKKCFNCGEAGHFSNNCPNPKVDRGGRDNTRGGRGGFRGSNRNNNFNNRNKSRSRSRSKEHGGYAKKEGLRNNNKDNAKTENVQEQNNWGKPVQMEEESNKQGGWNNQTN